MISRSESLLEKYAGLNWFDDTFSDFEPRLERGEIPVAGIKPWFLIRTYCTDCDEPALAIRYHGRRILIIANQEFFIPHQCPDPAAEVYPDDPEVRDGDGRLVAGGWTDPGPEPDPFNDDPYVYPDIPYVDPTRGNHR